MKKEDILNIVKEAFNNNISTSIGDYFGSPTSYIDGKEEFYKELKEKLGINEEIFETKIHCGNKTILQGKYNTLEEAKKQLMNHTKQIKYEGSVIEERGVSSYGQIIHTKNNEIYKNYYFLQE